MNLGTRPARPGRSHFPKVVLGRKRQNAFGRQVLEPQLARFIVTRRLLVAFKVRGIQAVRIKAKLFRQTLESHVNGTRLEVVAKAPIAQHFKKGVMVHVLADIVQVIVLAACANAFLRVDGALKFGHFQVWIARS